MVKVRKISYVYDDNGNIINDFVTYEEIDQNEFHWFTKSTKSILEDHLSVYVNDETIKQIESLLDSLGLFVFEMIYYIKYLSKDDLFQKNLTYMLNNSDFFFSQEFDRNYILFCEKTIDLSSIDKKEALEFFKYGTPIDMIVDIYKKESFHENIIDEFDIQVIDQKTANFLVGQIMKKYPKQFDAKTVKQAIENRFKI